MKDYSDAHTVNNCSAFPILAQGQSDIQYFTESTNMAKEHWDVFSFIPFALKMKLWFFLICNIFFCSGREKEIPHKSSIFVT